MFNFKPKQLILAISILIFSLGLAGCDKKPITNNNQNQNINTNTTVDEIDTSSWQTYRNKEYGFEIEYPQEWVFQELKEGIKNWEEDMAKPVIGVLFGTPESKQGGYAWVIEFYRKPNELENDIALIGNQFSDRKETRKNIKIGDNDVLLVTVIANTYKNWISEAIYFSREDKLFVIKNGAINDARFENFYKSFRFTQ